MTGFERQGDTLFCEEVALGELASQFGTPLYVYSRASIEQAYLAYEAALADHARSRLRYCLSGRA